MSGASELRERIEAAVEQPRPRLRAGTLWIRGSRVVLVRTVDGADLAVVDEDGTEATMDRDRFFARAVESIEMPPPPPLIERAWAIAKSVALPPADRLSSLRRMATRAGEDDARTIVGWMASISTGERPRRGA